MKFGAMLVYEGLSDPTFLAEVGTIVEDLGFDSLWLADHVVVPSVYSSVYPYNAQGKVTTVPFPEPLVSLGFLAAVTRRVTLGTAVLILPQRNPVLLAKQAATLDRLAAGRLRLGVGIGWLREEFAALGADFEARGARTDEYIDAMRALWTQPEAVLNGRFVSLSGFGIEPRPERTGGVPIVVGGHTPAAARRAGRRGDGFFPFVFTTAELAPLVELAREEAAATGRSATEVEMVAPTSTEPDWLEHLAEIGVDHVVLPAASPTPDIEAVRATLGRFSERVMAPRR